MSDAPNEVTALPRRPRSYTMFADLTGMADTRVLAFIPAGPDGREITVTFDRNLTPEERTAVWERLTSVDDDDLAARALLRDLIADVDALEDTPLTRLLLHLARRDLSEQPPPEST